MPIERFDESYWTAMTPATSSLANLGKSSRRYEKPPTIRSLLPVKTQEGRGTGVARTMQTDTALVLDDPNCSNNQTLLE